MFRRVLVCWHGLEGACKASSFRFRRTHSRINAAHAGEECASFGRFPPASPPYRTNPMGEKIIGCEFLIVKLLLFSVLRGSIGARQSPHIGAELVRRLHI